MLYTIIFLTEDRHTDQMWFTNPKVGDVVKTNLLTDEELEYWVIKSIEHNIVYLEKQ